MEQNIAGWFRKSSYLFIFHSLFSCCLIVLSDKSNKIKNNWGKMKGNQKKPCDAVTIITFRSD